MYFEIHYPSSKCSWYFKHQIFRNHHRHYDLFVIQGGPRVVAIKNSECSLIKECFEHLQRCSWTNFQFRLYLVQETSLCYSNFYFIFMNVFSMKHFNEISYCAWLWGHFVESSLHNETVNFCSRSGQKVEHHHNPWIESNLVSQHPCREIS